MQKRVRWFGRCVLKGAWGVLAALVLSSASFAQDWGAIANISTTMGVSDSRLCIGEASRGDIGCPSYAPTVSSTGTLNISAGLAVDSVSLSTAGTTWGYFTNTASYLPYLNSLGVSATNISASTINGIAVSALGASATVISGTTTMVEGWPDALACTLGGQADIRYFFLASYSVGSPNYYVYRTIERAVSGGDVYTQILFTTAGAYSSFSTTNANYTSAGTCDGKSIATLYSEGKAFNFIGSSGSSSGVSTFAALTDVSSSIGGGTIYGPGSTNGAVAGYTANTAFGVHSLSSTLLAGSGNSGFGYSALRSIRGGSINTAAGYNALYGVTSGSNNTAIGGDSLYSVTAGSYNSAVGRYALNSNTGEYNSAMGANSLRNKTSGNYNTAAGYYAGYGVGGASNGNAFFGAYAGQGIGTGGSNTLIGYNAGGGVSTGSGNIVIGADTSPYSNTGSSQLNIGNTIWGNIGSGLGYANMVGINVTSPTTHFAVSGTTYLAGVTGIGATPNASYQLYVGGNAYSTGTWGSSDARYKEQVKTLGGLLAKVEQLRPVTFIWTKDSPAGKSGDTSEQIGVIAQEVEKVLPDLVKTDKDGYKAVAYDKLSVITLGAVQELKAENDALKAQQATMAKELKALRTELEALKAR